MYWKMLTDRKGTQVNFAIKNSEHWYSMLEEAACIKWPGATSAHKIFESMFPMSPQWTEL